jgi:hypothetical protein
LRSVFGFWNCWQFARRRRRRRRRRRLSGVEEVRGRVCDGVVLVRVGVGGG